MILGYSRISKGDDQNAGLQLQSFEAEKVGKVFEEIASGGRWDRPALHKMLDQLREGDIVVVWKLDRLARSLKQLIETVEDLEARKIGLKSLTENILFSTDLKNSNSER